MATKFVTMDEAEEFVVGSDKTDSVFIQAVEGVELFFEGLCGRILGRATYTNERYDGNGSTVMYLDHYPVVSIETLSIGTATGMTIENTSSDCTYATIQVDSTNLRLKVVGGTNAHDWYEIALSGNTIQDVVDAVNAYGKGWTASTDYGDYVATQLLERTGADASQSEISLAIPDSPNQSYLVDMDTGEIKLLDSVFSAGTKNVIVTYTAGYNTSTAPNDLKIAILTLLKIFWESRGESTMGLKSFKLGDIQKVFADGYPEVVSMAIYRYGDQLA